MPTYEQTTSFRRDCRALSPKDKELFQAAVLEFVEDLRGIEAGTQTGFRPGLRIQKVNRRAGVLEMTWAGDGRATFSWGEEVIGGMRHVIWRRCGSHAILRQP